LCMPRTLFMRLWRLWLTCERAHLDTITGTQPSDCRGVSIAPCRSVNAAFLFAKLRMLVAVSRCDSCEPSTKSQTPSSRECPISKSQRTPQDPLCWSSRFGASLVLGTWDLELSPVWRRRFVQADVARTRAQSQHRTAPVDFAAQRAGFRFSC